MRKLVDIGLKIEFFHFLPFLSLPICLECVTPLVKLDRRAEVRAHVRYKRDISSLNAGQSCGERVDYECRYFSE